MMSNDPTCIPLEKNIRELLKNTIFAHPDDLKKTSKKKKTVPSK